MKNYFYIIALAIFFVSCEEEEEEEEYFDLNQTLINSNHLKVTNDYGYQPLYFDRIEFNRRKPIFEIGAVKYISYWSKYISPNLDRIYKMDSLQFFSNGIFINTLNDFEELETIDFYLFDFYDYDMDEKLDFRVMSLSRTTFKGEYYDYYFYDSEQMKMVHDKNWDWIKIDSIDRGNKKILTTFEGNDCKGSQKEYNVIARKLELIREIPVDKCLETY